MSEITFGDIHSETTTELMTAAKDESGIPTGKYLVKTTKVTVQQNDDDADFDPGRQVASLAVAYLDAINPKRKAGQGFIRVSWDMRRTPSGSLDSASKRYSELAKALSMDGKDPAAVLAAAAKQLFMVRGRESYTITDEEDLYSDHVDTDPFNGNYYVRLGVDDDDAREHYTGLGYDSKFTVDRIFKAK